MLTLKVQDNFNHHFIHIEKFDSELWIISVGRWWMGHNDAPQLEPTVLIKMDVYGLKKLLDELLRVLKLQFSNLTPLDLFFVSNEPKLILEVCTMKSGARFYKDSLDGMFRIEASIDSEYSCVRPLITGFEEEHNLEFTASYKTDNKMRWKLSEYFFESDLRDFVLQIEMEIINFYMKPN